MMPSALIVEDNPVIARNHEALLRSSGFVTRIARNGHEAVNLVNLGRNFDVIFINKKLPMLDGIMATLMLRSLDIKSVIVGVTVVDEPERQMFLDAGLDDCFDIPLNSESIVRVFHLLRNVGSFSD